MKTARTPTVPKRIRVIDRGDWAIFRIPAALLTETQRSQVVGYIRQLPRGDAKWSGAIESWCIKSAWLEPVVELVEHVIGTKVPVEG
jgi:hypothetical protein